jgi:hypothetical protein
LEWLSDNASGAQDRLVDVGLYNENFPIPGQGIAVKDGSTIYVTIRNDPEEISKYYIELHQSWPELYGSDYHNRRSMDITLQLRVYNRSNTDFRYAVNYVSSFVNSYTNGRISGDKFDRDSVKFGIHNPAVLPNVSANIDESSG